MSYTKHSKRKGNKKNGKGGVIFVAAIIGVILAGILRQNFLKDHFARNTVIQGADCSYFSVPKAANVISEVLSNETITLVFGEKQYQFQGRVFGLELSGNEELEKFLEQQHTQSEEGANYTLQNSLKVNEDMVRKCLENIDELKPENMVKPQNAFIKITEDGTLAIEDEVLGSEIEFDEALAMCIENLLYGETTIDFYLIANVPEILSTDEELNTNVNAMNHILSTVINFELADGSIFTLDKETMKSWICIDEDGVYYIDGSNINDFIDELNTKVQETGNSIMFTPSDHNPIPLPVNDNTLLTVNAEVENRQIREALEKSGTYTRKPIYEKEFDMAEFSSYVEIDISRQQVWLYYEGECILNGVPCVTGSVAGGHSTPTGVYYLTSKRKNATLRGYNNDGSRYASFVNFWMPFNRGIGMHDATWRAEFGGEIYQTNGSHGCVNMRYEDAKTVYEYIDKTMPIIVYASGDFT